MPKYKILKEFKDTHTKEIYSIGNEIELTEERYEEVVRNLSSEFIEPTKKKETKKKTTSKG